MSLIQQIIFKKYTDKEIAALINRMDLMQAEIEELKGNPPAPDKTPPTNVTNLTANNVTTSTVDLAWGAATDNVGVTGYEVYNGAELITTVTTLTHKVTGLVEDTDYTFTVRAKDAAGNKSSGSSVTAKTLVSGLPNSVTGLQAIDVADESVTLKWNQVLGADGYEVYDGQTFIGNTDRTTYDIDSLVPEMSYTFTVKTKSGSFSSKGVDVNATTLTGPVGDESAYLWVGGVENE